MTEERWQNIVSMVESKFKTLEHKKENLPLEQKGKAEILIFLGPQGKMKLEYITKPRLLDEKTTYSRRIGSSVKVEKVYDKEEKVRYIKAYKWDEDKNDWQEIEAGRLGY